jgi:methylmalonyl-CoA mutase N-terminal domain/subunit
MVGVNRYVDATPSTTRVFQIDPLVEQRQVERVRALRAGRSTSDWRAALDAVERAARGGENLVAPIITAMEKQATLGEVANVLRQVFGEYRETQT